MATEQTQVRVEPHRYEVSGKVFVCNRCGRSPRDPCHQAPRSDHEFRPDETNPQVCAVCGQLAEPIEENHPMSENSQDQTQPVRTLQQQPQPTRPPQQRVQTQQQVYGPPTGNQVGQTAAQSRVEDLKKWWVNTAADDIEGVAAKAVTYGSNSLEQLGRKMAQLNGRRDISSEEAQELGCWANAVQKMERWTDAVMRGERPQDDTILDLVAYATMTRRIRQAGGWPDGQGE